ncbi:MAG: hypothetical protein Q4F66_00930 [Clostridium sp.]|nr:hypothetical protein [Clostridium sp.]
MKKDITVTIKGQVSDEALENYYMQLWMAIKEQYGDDVLKELYDELCKET